MSSFKMGGGAVIKDSSHLIKLLALIKLCFPSSFGLIQALPINGAVF